MIDMGALTDHVLARLESAFGTGATAPLVGDGEAPRAGGWSGGQPSSGVFRPYTVLVGGGAAPRFLNLGEETPCWAVGWSLRSFAGTRAAVDKQATRSREAIEALEHGVFGDGEWKVIGVEWVNLGPVVRVDATNPPMWQVFDTVNLVCSS